jgi:hypothetical protein
MLTSTLLTVLSACALAAGQDTDAPEVLSNPVAAYGAEVDAGKISGWAKASSEAGKAVAFTVDIVGLPEEGGPFSTFHPKRGCMQEQRRGDRGSLANDSGL